MTVPHLILSSLLLLILDVLFSIIYMRIVKPPSTNQRWKIPVWIIVAITILTLTILTSYDGSQTIWKAICYWVTIPCGYMILKNGILGLYWHNNFLYLGTHGWDGWIQKYTNNGFITFTTYLLIALVGYGLWGYVQPTTKLKKEKL